MIVRVTGSPGATSTDCPVGGERRLVEIDEQIGRSRLDTHLCDPAVGGRHLLLHELQTAVGRAQFDLLADRIEAIGDPPRGGEVAVDRHRGAVLGSEGERFAVAGGAHHEPAVEHRHRLLGGVLGGEHGETLIGDVLAQRVARRTAGLGEAGDVLRTAPLVGPVAVGVGDDQHGIVRHGVVADPCGGEGGQIGGVDDRLGAVEQSGCGGVDHAVATAGQHHHIGRGAHDRLGSLHRHQLHGRQRGAEVGDGERLLVDHGDVGHVHGGLAVRRRRTESGRGRTEQRRDDLRAWGAEAVEGQVVGHPDRVDAEQTGDRCDGLGIDRARLEPVVERVQQVHRPGAAEREEVAGDERLVGEAGQRRVDGVAPPEGTELRARQLQHAVLRRAGVERRDRVVPRRRDVLVALEGDVDVAAAAWRPAGRAAAISTSATAVMPPSWRRRIRMPPARVTSAPAPRARPKPLSGSARVLLRRARPSAESRSGAMSGDGSSIGWTPTASTMPATTSQAANRRCDQRTNARPARHSTTSR